MTLKSLFSKAFWQRFIRRANQFNWITAVWSVVLFFTFPVAGALIFSIDQGIENYWTIDRVSSVITVQMVVACAFTMIVAVLTPNAFNYINSRKELDFYHSQPVTRKELFWRNYFVGWLCFLAPFTIGVLCEIGVIMLLPGIAFQNLWPLFWGSLSCISAYFSVNVLCLLAVMVCGNRFISLVTGIYFCFAGEIVFLMLRHYINNFSVNMNYNSFFGDVLGGLSPVVFTLGSVMSISDISGILLFWYAFWYVISFAALFLARKLYLRRKSETAGKPLSYPKASLFIKYPLTLFCAWIGSRLFVLISDSTVWGVFAFLTFGIISYCIINGLEAMEFRKAFRGWLKLLLTGAVYLSVIAVLFVGCFLLNIRTTKTENIKSIDLTGLNYYEKEKGGREYRIDESLYDITDKEAIEIINSLCQRAVHDDFGAFDMFDSVRYGYYGYASDGDGGTAKTDKSRVAISITFHTKFGSYTRGYYFDARKNDGTFESLVEFSQSAGAKKAYAEAVMDSIPITNSKIAFVSTAVTTTSAQMKDLYNALNEDIQNSTLKDYESRPLGTVTVCYYFKTSYTMDYKNYIYETFMVYPSYKKTLELVDYSELNVSEDYFVGEFINYPETGMSEDDKEYSEGYEKGRTEGQNAAALEKEYPMFTYYPTTSYEMGYLFGIEDGYGMFYDTYDMGDSIGYAKGYELGKLGTSVDEYDFILNSDNIDHLPIFYHGFRDGYNRGYSDAKETGK